MAVVHAVIISLVLLIPGESQAPDRAMEWVRVSPDRRSFVLEPSGRRFSPWGFNYDHDEKGRLIEDYWEKEWPKVEQDFGEMKKLGANVVRVHLQLGKFMIDAEQAQREEPGSARPTADAGRADGPLSRPDRPGLLPQERRARVVRHALGTGRWAVQARFWEAIARRCADSPAVFCYDLMNEPVVPGKRDPATGWPAPSPASTSSSSSRSTRGTGPGPTSPASGSTR